MAESVVCFCKEKGADLVVVGSRGMGAVKSAIMSLVGLGSVSSEHRTFSCTAAPCAAPHSKSGGAGCSVPAKLLGVPAWLAPQLLPTRRQLPHWRRPAGVTSRCRLPGSQHARARGGLPGQAGGRGAQGGVAARVGGAKQPQLRRRPGKLLGRSQAACSCCCCLPLAQARHKVMVSLDDSETSRTALEVRCDSAAAASPHLHTGS